MQYVHLSVLVICSMCVSGGLGVLSGTYPIGTCVCATTNVNGRSQGSLRGTVMTTLLTGECVLISGGVVNSGGYTWYRTQRQGQDLWVVGRYLQRSRTCDIGVSSMNAMSCPPSMVTRAEWGARSPRSVSYLSGPVQYVFIHHTESGSCTDRASCDSRMRGFQNYHMDSKHWSDIGYSFLVAPDGTLYEGRGWDRVGAHTRGYNRVGIAFSFIGNFMTTSPTEAAINTVQRAIACGVTMGKVIPNYTLRGHRDMGTTSCPGDVLYSIIQTWPHYY